LQPTSKKTLKSQMFFFPFFKSISIMSLLTMKNIFSRFLKRIYLVFLKNVSLVNTNIFDKESTIYYTSNVPVYCIKPHFTPKWSFSYCIGNGTVCFIFTTVFINLHYLIPDFLHSNSWQSCIPFFYIHSFMHHL